MPPAKPLPLDPLSLRNLRRGVSLATDKYKVGGRPKEGPYAVKPITLRLEEKCKKEELI
jgi:hypothetical protein